MRVKLARPHAFISATVPQHRASDADCLGVHECRPDDSGRVSDARRVARPAEGRLLNEFRDAGRARRARDGGALAGLELTVPSVDGERAIAPHRPPA